MFAPTCKSCFIDNLSTMCYISYMRCIICQNEFVPNKYHPRQQVCLRSDCQKARQLNNERDWRGENPDYFKSLGQESYWKEVRQRYSKLWRVNHKDYLKSYEKAHQKERREYMRNYMRRYRNTGVITK